MPSTSSLRQLLPLAIAIVIAVGSYLIVTAIGDAVVAQREARDWGLIALLLLVSIIAGEFPIKFGQGEIFLTIACVPSAMAAIYLPPHDAILLAMAYFMWADRKLPLELGWRRGGEAFCFDFASAAIAMFVTTQVVAMLGERADADGPVLLLPALAVSATLELVTFAQFPLIVERLHAGAFRDLLRNAPGPLGANVFLPTVALASLSPYAHSAAQVAVLLPIVLLVMYFALWVANSQQLEKRRGEHLRETFSRYVPEALVSQHIDTMDKVQLGGEQRDISVLFCDIRGFTSWSEHREAGEIITELNVLLSELSQAVMGTEGTLDKFTGDGLMAFWGAPFPQPDHAARACEAALDMLRRLDEVNERRVTDGHEPFTIGVGVHTGTAVVGNVGHEERLDYTAIGDTVNLAARLEAATKDIGSVLVVSDTTARQLPPRLASRAMLVGDISVKGRTAPVEVWALQPRRPKIGDFDLDLEFGPGSIGETAA